MPHSKMLAFVLGRKGVKIMKYRVLEPEELAQSIDCKRDFLIWAGIFTLLPFVGFILFAIFG